MATQHFSEGFLNVPGPAGPIFAILAEAMDEKDGAMTYQQRIMVGTARK